MLAWPQSKRTRISLLVTVLIIVIAGTILYVQRPEAVVERALNNASELATADFTATLALENNTATEQTLGEEGTLEITVDGVYARHDDTRDTLGADVTFTTKTESVTVNVEGEIRLIDDQAYVHITRAPAALPVIPQLKGKWFVLPRRGDTSNAPAAANVEASIENVEREGSERINDTRTVKYTAEATPEAVIRFMDILADILGTSLTNDQIADITEGVASGTRVPLEVWVGSSGRLRQLTATLKLTNGNTTRLTIHINEHNPDIAVDVPSNATTLEEALTPPTTPEE